MQILNVGVFCMCCSACESHLRPLSISSALWRLLSSFIWCFYNLLLITYTSWVSGWSFIIFFFFSLRLPYELWLCCHISVAAEISPLHPPPSLCPPLFIFPFPSLLGFIYLFFATLPFFPPICIHNPAWCGSNQTKLSQIASIHPFHQWCGQLCQTPVPHCSQ